MLRTARILLRFALSLAGFLALLALGALGVYCYPYIAGLLLFVTALILFMRLAVAPFVPLLLAKLKESGGRNQEVIQALGRIGPGAAAAIPLLEEIAKSGWNPELRSHAARALREIRKARR